MEEESKTVFVIVGSIVLDWFKVEFEDTVELTVDCSHDDTTAVAVTFVFDIDSDNGGVGKVFDDSISVGTTLDGCTVFVSLTVTLTVALVL